MIRDVSRSALLSRVQRARPAGPPRTAAAAAAGAGVPWRNEPAAFEPGWGCGWFDSSHDLRCGLAVLEDPPGVLELAIGLWLGAAPPRG